MEGSDVVAAQEFRQDQTGVLPDGSGEMAGYDDDEMADGYDDVGASDDELDSSAPSDGYDDGEDEDPQLVALREQVLGELKPQLEAELRAAYDTDIAKLRSTKDREIAQARTTESLLRGQMDEVLGFLRQNWTAENGHDPRDLTDLENRLFRRRDTVQQQAAQSVAAWTSAQTELSNRFQEVSDGIARGRDGQHVIPPAAIMEHPDVVAAKQYAWGLAEQFYARGAQPGSDLHQRSQAAFRNLNDTQNRVGRALMEEALRSGTRQKTAKVRKDQQARGPQVQQSRAGGTGTMTDDRAWEIAKQRHPEDPGKRHLEYMKLLKKVK